MKVGTDLRLIDGAQIHLGLEEPLSMKSVVLKMVSADSKYCSPFFTRIEKDPLMR